MRGTYVLLVRVPRDIELAVGSLGTVEFEAGWYAYVGSALGNLEKRVERHARREKKKHWHIDYLLTEGKIVGVIYGEGRERKECEIAAALAKHHRSVPRFGSSDCRCESHLFFSPELGKLKRTIVEGFKSAGLRPLEGAEIGKRAA